MLTALLHVGYAVSDLEQAIPMFAGEYGFDVVREVEVPRYNLRAVFLEAGSSTIELIEFHLPELALRRLAGETIRLDHVAYSVADIDAAALAIKTTGGHLCAPDGSEVDEPLELGGARHVWTSPAGASGLWLQLIG